MNIAGKVPMLVASPSGFFNPISSNSDVTSTSTKHPRISHCPFQYRYCLSAKVKVLIYLSNGQVYHPHFTELLTL